MKFGALFTRARNSDLIRQGVLVFLSLTGANVLNYAFYAIVGRMVGVENYGVFTAVTAAIIICTTPAIIGQTVVAKLAAEFCAVDDIAGLRGFADAVTMFAIGLGALLGLAGIVLEHPLAQFLQINDPAIIAIAAVALAVWIVIWLGRGVFQGAGAFGTFGISNLLEGLGKTVFAAGLVIVAGLRGAFAGLAIGLCLTAVYNTLRLRRQFGHTSRRFHANYYRLAISASATGSAVFAITTMVLFDVILVKHYFGPRDAGLYGAAALVGRALYTVVAFVPTVVLPKATTRAAASRSPLPLLVAAGGVTIICCAAALLIFRLAPAHVVTAIAGQKFADAAPLVFPYGCAIAALATANVFAMYKIGVHRFDFVRPLLLVMVGEIICVIVRHRFLTDVLQTIVIGHTMALAVVVWRLTAVPQRIVLADSIEAAH